MLVCPQSLHIAWSPEQHVEQDKLCPLETIQFKRTTRLYSEASGGHLQIFDNGRVDGLGKETSQYGKSLNSRSPGLTSCFAHVNTCCVIEQVITVIRTWNIVYHSCKLSL